MSLIRRSEERTHIITPKSQGGPGRTIGHKIIESDADLWGKGRLFNQTILEKDCGVGYHVHEDDGEIYLVLSGEAEYNDNGTITTLYPGDVTFTNPGEGHAITNHKDEPVVFIALILYE